MRPDPTPSLRALAGGIPPRSAYAAAGRRLRPSRWVALGSLAAATALGALAWRPFDDGSATGSAGVAGSREEAAAPPLPPAPPAGEGRREPDVVKAAAVIDAEAVPAAPRVAAGSTAAKAAGTATTSGTRLARQVATAAEAATFGPAATLLHGTASYYAAKFEGRTTASGERYRGSAMTAAHRTLPFGTRVRVTNPHNGRSVVLRINDRGPFHPRRVIDVSRSAAIELGILRRGRAPVEIEVID